jgi:hypothetical protein
MPGWAIALIVVVIVLAAAVVILLIDRQRSARLRSRFGPEYERTLHEHGDRRRAEKELARRQERVEKLQIHPLSMRDHDRFVAAWRADQARFVDDPPGAVTEADRLVQEVMKARGYPVADFDQRLEDISVDHPHLVRNYMAARDIVLLHRRGQASTEELRKALVYYRGLFDELLEAQEVTR